MINKYNRITFEALNALIEFRTSIAIITSVFMGTIYGYYTHKAFDLSLFLSMITASVFLDGAATVFNHYFDFKKAKTKEGYLYNIHNPIVFYNLSPAAAFIVGVFLVLFSALLGIYIILSTHWILLFVGGLSILIGYYYSGGKYPISYSPFGELVSGLFEGSIVFSISYFLQSHDFNVIVFFISIPVTLGISNIMLANNICDTEEDKINGRKTLPIVVGLDCAVKFLYLSHIMMYLLNTIYLIHGYLPKTIFAVYLSVPIMINNLMVFNNNRTKEKGFVYVLKNTIFFNFMVISALWLSIIL